MICRMRTRLRIRSIRAIGVGAACGALLLSIATTSAQQTTPPPPPPAQAPAPPPNPNAAATAADHRNMMEQLGITALRPGPSGNESAPNHANYDEALANPYPNLPEVLTLENGQKVTRADGGGSSGGRRSSKSSTARCSAGCRRDVPKVTWVVNRTENFTVGGMPVVGKELIGKVDNAGLP